MIEVHTTLAICTLGPDKVALIERWLYWSSSVPEFLSKSIP